MKETFFEPEKFHELVGEEIITLINDNAPTKVMSRVVNAALHVEKAIKLKDIDVQMAAIRFIAAEEELVVAIFEWFKLNKEKMPQHSELVKSFKNHQVKLMFTPVLLLMKNILWHCFGPMLEGHSSDVIAKPKYENGKVILMLKLPFSNVSLPLNPLSVLIGGVGDDTTESNIIDSLYSELEDKVKELHGLTLREFVTKRADFRNTILYAGDGMISNYAIDFEELSEGFFTAYEALLWSLAALLTNDPLSPHLGVVSQFVSIYKKVLTDTKVLKIKNEMPNDFSVL